MVGLRPLAKSALVLSLAAMTAAPVPAHAAPKSHPPDAEPAAEQYAARAVERFKAKDFEAAAKLFMQAYARDPKAALVFNAARAYEEAGKSGDAASLFRLYITISQDADGIVDARTRLKKLEGPRAPPGAPVPAVTSVPAIALAAAPTAHESAAEPAPLRWSVTIAAGAAVAGGVALFLVARNASLAANDLKLRNPADVQTYNDRFDHAESLQGWAVATTAVGAGLAAWATWLHLHARPAQGSVQWQAGPQAVAMTVHF